MSPVYLLYSLCTNQQFITVINLYSVLEIPIPGALLWSDWDAVRRNYEFFTATVQNCAAIVKKQAI